MLHTKNDAQINERLARNRHRLMLLVLPNVTAASISAQRRTLIGFPLLSIEKLRDAR